MALACVRQSRGRSLADCGFCLIFKGFSLDCGRNLDNYRGRGKATRSGKKYRGRGVVVHGSRLPDLGKKYRGRGKNCHGSRLINREKRITGHGSRFVWYDLKPVSGAMLTVINLHSGHKKSPPWRANFRRYRGGLFYD